MSLALPMLAPADADVLWRPVMWGRQRYLLRRRYWYDNRTRRPGVCVLQWTIQGEVAFVDARGRHAVPPQHVMLFTYGAPTAYGLTAAHTRPYECMWVNLMGAGLPEHWQALERRHGPVWSMVGSDGLARMEHLIALAAARPGTDLTTLARATAELVYWLMDWAEQRLTSRQSPVERAVEQILRQPTLALSLKNVADQYGCSREHLCRHFADRVGQSPGKYLAQARLDHARQLLSQTTLPIHDIARQSGFASAHTLARRLRQATGRSPSQWRTRKRG